LDLGGASLGTLLGGGLASVLGITAPFWLGSGVARLAVGRGVASRPPPSRPKEVRALP
jgi:hypothetical protein